MNFKRLLFDTEVTNVLKEIYHMTPFLTQDTLPHTINHLEGVLYIHDNEYEEVPYLMQEDGTVVYLDFADVSTDYREFKNKNVIIIGKKDSGSDVFHVHDIQKD
jgi:hypothetical protein